MYEEELVFTLIILVIIFILFRFGMKLKRKDMEQLEKYFK
jgi:preprotein translocase subunit YajC